MLIYRNEQDVIDSVRAHAERKIIAIEKMLKNCTERSQAGLQGRAAKAAYGDVLWMLTDYELREPLASSDEAAT